LVLPPRGPGSSAADRFGTVPVVDVVVVLVLVRSVSPVLVVGAAVRPAPAAVVGVGVRLVPDQRPVVLVPAETLLVLVTVVTVSGVPASVVPQFVVAGRVAGAVVAPLDLLAEVGRQGNGPGVLLDDSFRQVPVVELALGGQFPGAGAALFVRSEEHTSEL